LLIVLDILPEGVMRYRPYRTTPAAKPPAAPATACELFRPVAFVDVEEVDEDWKRGRAEHGVRMTRVGRVSLVLVVDLAAFIVIGDVLMTFREKWKSSDNNAIGVNVTDERGVIHLDRQ
jgi:hypothetical protein